MSAPQFKLLANSSTGQFPFLTGPQSLCQLCARFILLFDGASATLKLPCTAGRRSPRLLQEVICPTLSAQLVVLAPKPNFDLPPPPPLPPSLCALFVCLTAQEWTCTAWGYAAPASQTGLSAQFLSFCPSQPFSSSRPCPLSPEQ